VFGVFSGEMTPGGGMAVVRKEGADFILYSLEDGPFDIATMQNYMRGMMDVAGADALERHPVVLRVPPIGDAVDEARAHVAEALAAGVKGIVFPHVQTAEEAALSVEMLSDAWPARPDGELINVLIIEDQAGIANARAIMSTPGLSVVFAGPGDLRRAYDGDMEAVENAIQTVLAACREFDVACGVTAGVDDVAARIEQGFQVIIVLEDEALPLGREAAGRGAP
jgi:2-keto-3-deoxy-L-rhamnonate aldolase RhmA